MDQKTWSWKRKPSEKFLLRQRAVELEKSIHDLNEELSTCQSELKAKDARIVKQAKVAEEAISGWEKTEAEAEYYKNQLNNTLLEKQILEENIRKMEETVNDYIQRLELSKRDFEQANLEAARKITLEQDKIRVMQETISEKNNKIAALGAEINCLLKTLEDVNESRLHLESSLHDAKARIDLVEKTNSSLRYELCMVQKEVEIRTQEREFDHKSANAAHKQHLESIKKVAKLEAECQRLRVMVKKRLPGPAALAKMKNEVETLGFSGNISTNNKTNTNRSLLDRLNAMEQENRVLKETLARANGEIKAARAMNPRTRGDYRVSSLDLKIEEDNASCAESGSWASALVAELDNFKSQKPTSVTSCKSPTGLSELSLMDDFVEMEKLALEDAKSCVTTKEVESKPEKELMEKAVLQVVEFLEGIIEKAIEQKYVARVFLWESKGLKGVLQNFILVCNDFINEKAKVENFVSEVGVTLDWVVNHCFSLQDVSEMREAIVKDFGGSEPNCWNGLEGLLNSPRKMTNHMRVFSEINVRESADDTLNGELINNDNKEKELEERQKFDTDDTDGELIESGSKSKENLKVLRELKVLLEEEQVSNGVENGDFTNGASNKQTLVNDVEIQEATIKDTPSLECRTTLGENMKDTMGQEEEKHANIDLQISSASEKLAECQDTITSISQQLKLLASPTDAPLFDKLDTPVSKEAVVPETKNPKPNAVRRSLEAEFNAAESSQKPVEMAPKVQLGTLALVPKRNPEGTNLLRKLLMRRKRESFKKLTMPVGA